MVGFPRIQPAADPDGAVAADAAGPLDGLAQQKVLHAKFTPANDPAPAAAVPVAKPAAAAPSRSRKLVRRTLKTAVGLALLIAIGWMPLSRYLEAGSVEAVVNARLVTIRAPIDGEIVAQPGALNVGTSIAPGRTLFRIVNRRADRGSLNELTRQIDLLEADRNAIAGRLISQRQFLTLLTDQSRAFQAGRVLQLEARVAETEANIAAAVAKRQEAVAALGRAAALARQGIQSQAALDHATSENTAAVESETAARKRLAAVTVELDAARRGVFVGDSYNDQPNSSQRAVETEFRIRELEAELAAKDARLARLKSQSEDEARRYADLAAADLTTPVEGRVWEMLTAPGEEVRRGQDLMRVLDCSAAVVTTTVSEKLFNRLQLGDAALVQIAGANESHEGRIIHLTGIASPPENLAIQPAALTREAFRVTVAVPDIKQACAVGRSGRVVFAPSGAAPAGLGTRLAALFGR
jgi:multidrug resistance efflux pump